MKRKLLLIAGVLQQQLLLQNRKNKVLFLLILLTGLAANGKPGKGVQKYPAALHKHKKALLTNPTLSYNSPNTFYKGAAITPLAPASTGVNPLGYNAPVVIGQTGIHLGAGTAVDASGNVYVSSHDNLSNTSIIEIPANGGPFTQIGFGFSQPGALAVDAAGDVFAVDGQNIKEILAGNTNTITIGTTGNFSSPNAIAVDAANNLYVADRSPDVPGIKEFQYSGGIYSSSYIMIGSGFNMPYGVAVDAAGNVFVADYANSAIKEIAAGNGPVTTVAAFSYPVSVAIDNSGNLFVAGSGETYGSIVELPAGNYNTPVVYGSGIENAAEMSVDASGNVYLADAGHDEIKEIPAGNGTPVTLAPGYKNPEEVAIDAAGNVFVADAYNGAVREIPVSGGNYPLTVAPGFNFSLPYGVAVDAANNLYVGDAGVGMIYKIPQGSNTPVAIGSGLSNVVAITIDAKGNLYACSNGPDLYEIAAGSNTTKVVNTGFNTLASVAVDAAGNIYGFDLANYNIYKLPSGGAGTPVVLATNVGRGHYLTVDAAGNVYIGLNGNGSPSGIEEISAVNGTPAMVATTVGVPYGVAIDGAGNLYCTDVTSNLVDPVIDKITPGGGYFLNTALPAGLTFDNTTGIISGTPTAQTPSANYIVTAYNSSGSAAATVNISVLDNANLANLQISRGTLTPAFAAGTAIYTDVVVNGVVSITVTPTASNPHATIAVNNASVTSGTASGPIPLNVGANNISIVVTAPDGVTKRTYTLTVTRTPSSNANLSSLKPSRGALNPVFTSTVTSYTATVVNGVTSLTITPTTASPDATVTVNGIAVTSGVASGAIPLVVGPNVITTVVTAQDGTTKTYTVTITREPAMNDLLSALKLSIGYKNEVFMSSMLNYTANEMNNVSSVMVIPTADDPNATILVDGADAVASGTASDPIALAVGTNTITVKVTAQDGVTNQTYTIVVTRAAGGADSFVSGISVGVQNFEPLLSDDGILVHPAVSPNGDGINDFLQIDGIQAFPDNKLSILNRSGQMIFEVKGYDNSSKVFDGHSNKNGQMQLPGTYFYQLDYTVAGITKHKTGFLVLKY